MLIFDDEYRIRDGIYVVGSVVSIKLYYVNYFEGKFVGVYILREFGYESELCIYEERFKEYELVVRLVLKFLFDNFNGEDV